MTFQLLFSSSVTKLPWSDSGVVIVVVCIRTWLTYVDVFYVIVRLMLKYLQCYIMLYDGVGHSKFKDLLREKKCWAQTSAYGVFVKKIKAEISHLLH